MFFQISDYKEKNFLDLKDDGNSPIIPLCSKDGIWLKHFNFSNSLYTCVTRLITNHTLISEYRWRFFPNELSTCPCSNVSIEMRAHILYDCE